MDNDHTPDVETKPTRCWYTQKRWILLLVVAILLSVGIYRGFYECLIPQPLQMSSVMCNSGEPLLPDGTPDYYAILVQRMAHFDGIKVSADADKAIHEIMSSDQNGFRDFLAALGPGLLVPDPSYSLQDAGGWGVPWSEWATNPRTKPYDETYWRPACEQLGVDPNAEPRLYAYRSFEPSCVYVNRSESTTDSTTSSDEWVDIGPKLSVRTYVSEPRVWRRENLPKRAEWLDANGEVLDLLGVAVRKPKFLIPCLRHTTYDIGSPESIAAFQSELKLNRLPSGPWSFYYESLAVQRIREIVRGELQARILLRIGERQDDAALFDLETMMRLADHLQHSHNFHAAVSGISISGRASGIVGKWLAQPELTDETLDKLQKLLESQSRNLRFDSLRTASRPGFAQEVLWYTECSFFVRWSSPSDIRRARKAFKWMDDYPPLSSVDNRSETSLMWKIKQWLLQNLPIDRNIAGDMLSLMRANDAGFTFNDPFQTEDDPTRRWESDQVHYRTMESIRQKYRDTSPWQLLSIRKRSQMFGLLVARCRETGNLWITQMSLRGQCQRQLSIIAVALERYRLAHGTYPETLESLTEYGLAIDTWMDSCSMAQRPINLRYRLEPRPLPYDPSSMCPYTLSCLSFDGQDDADFDESQRLDLPFNQRDRDDVFFP